jgi:hypothetical protein
VLGLRKRTLLRRLRMLRRPLRPGPAVLLRVRLVVVAVAVSVRLAVLLVATRMPVRRDQVRIRFHQTTHDEYSCGAPSVR